MMTDITAQDFFSSLYPDGLDGSYLEIRKIPPVVQTFATSIAEAVKAAKDGSQNVYFGVGLRRDRVGDEAHVTSIPALWTDVDLKNHENDQKRADAVIHKFEFEPSAIVSSGNGFHCYWLLKEPEEVTPENLLQLRGYLLGLARQIGGDPACRDLSRILRVPGSLNLKDRDNPKQVQMIRWNPERRYNLSDFDQWYIEDPVSGNRTATVDLDVVPTSLPERFIRRVESDAELRSAWEGVRQPPIDKSRSGFDAMLAGMLVVRDFADSEIASILQNYRHGKGEEATRPYLTKTIQHAKTYVTSVESARKGGPGSTGTPETSEGDGKEEDPTKGQESQADRLVKLALQDAQFFHDQTSTPYARVNIGDHLENLRSQSRPFRRWLARKMFEVEEKVPNAQALTSALNVIEGIATFDGECHEIYNRVAHHDDAIWYDLTDERWRAVQVTSDGWQVIDNPPILFSRYEHHARQVEPVKGGGPNRLFDFIAINDYGPRLLLLVYLVSCFIPNISHPVPVLHGPQGSGKSSAFRFLRRLIDPSAVEVLSLPRDSNEFIQMLSHHWFCPFDNITGLRDWQSDALCRAVSGEGFSKRQLYTDDDDIIYRFRRCCGLNGINIAATRADLLDRSILISLDRIPSNNRRTETDLWMEFDSVRPHILGGIFDALSEAMRLLPEVKLSTIPRMADFARWGCAISQALGFKSDDFLQAYNQNIEAQNEEVLQGHPVAAALRTLMKNLTMWDGTATELLNELEDVAGEQKINIKDRVWPKAPHILTRRLKEAQSNLVDAGIGISFYHSGDRSITIRRVPENSAQSVQASTGVENQGVIPERCEDTTEDMDTSSVQNSGSVKVSSTSTSLQDKGADATDGMDGKIPSSQADVLKGGRI